MLTGSTGIVRKREPFSMIMMPQPSHTQRKTAVIRRFSDMAAELRRTSVLFPNAFPVKTIRQPQYTRKPAVITVTSSTGQAPSLFSIPSA